MPFRREFLRHAPMAAASGMWMGWALLAGTAGGSPANFLVFFTDDHRDDRLSLVCRPGHQSEW